MDLAKSKFRTLTISTKHYLISAQNLRGCWSKSLLSVLVNFSCITNKGRTAVLNATGSMTWLAPRKLSTPVAKWWWRRCKCWLTFFSPANPAIGFLPNESSFRNRIQSEADSEVSEWSCQYRRDPVDHFQIRQDLCTAAVV